MRAQPAAPGVRTDEPLGIVISRGTREEAMPTVFAYIWGPGPGPTDESSRAA